MSGTPARVYIVEDETLIAMELEDRLTSLGYDVVGKTPRGETALKELPGLHAELVLMDVHLAGALNGIETAQRLADGCDAAIVFVTAYSDETLLQRSAGALPFGYLVKPVEERTLHASLQMALYRRRTEQTLRQQAELLQRRNTELEQFLRGASHDLQEPLRKLLSFTALLQEDLGVERTGPVAVDMAHIVSSAGEMRRRVQGLEDYARASRPAPHALLDLKQCLKNVLARHSVQLAERRAVIQHADLPQVWGDRYLICQLYEHLVTNALRHTPQQEPLLHFTAEQAEGHWILGVRDNGSGIKPEYHERIFAAFQSLDRRAVRGAGLGLTICRKVVESHQGRIWVESQPGQGTHIRFTLPGTATAAA